MSPELHLSAPRAGRRNSGPDLLLLKPSELRADAHRRSHRSQRDARKPHPRGASVQNIRSRAGDMTERRPGTIIGPAREPRMPGLFDILSGRRFCVGVNKQFSKLGPSAWQTQADGSLSSKTPRPRAVRADERTTIEADNAVETDVDTGSSRGTWLCGGRRGRARSSGVRTRGRL